MIILSIYSFFAIINTYSLCAFPLQSSLHSTVVQVDQRLFPLFQQRTPLRLVHRAVHLHSSCHLLWLGLPRSFDLLKSRLGINYIETESECHMSLTIYAKQMQAMPRQTDK